MHSQNFKGGLIHSFFNNNGFSKKIIKIYENSIVGKNTFIFNKIYLFIYF